MIKFEKVSFEQFKESCIKCNISKDEKIIKTIYDNIKLPSRGTTGSAGYDFYSPVKVHLPGEQIVISQIITPNVPPVSFVKDYILIPTGIRFVTDRNDVVLLCYPRSGLGVKYGVSIRNTTGVIDSDYQYSDNEGHIFAKIGSESAVDIEEGKAFMQGVITTYLTVDDEDTSKMETRNGGFGSTGR